MKGMKANMERQMSVDERIRRAEERYNRKNGLEAKTSKNRRFENFENKVESKNKKIKKKNLVTQMFVCLIIYIIFYTMMNWEYIFSDNFKNDVNVFFTQKLNLYQICYDVKSYIKNDNAEEDETNVNKTQEHEITENTTETTDGTLNKEANEATGETIDETLSGEANESGVGGAEETSEETVAESKDTAQDTEESQMEKDAREIKETISFIKPIEGTITSTFGWRTPTVSTVPKYHTGIDIGAVAGTVIKSATDGTIILASSEGDYGNHYQIQINDVVIIYAHCQKLYLNEGDTVSQGQKIAEVGSTGNSTGPHLHFEIRKEDRKVDPQLVLDF